MYADILGIIKRALDAKALQEGSAASGEPSLVTYKLQTLASSILAESAIVQMLPHKESIDIKDLDKTTTAKRLYRRLLQS